MDIGEFIRQLPPIFPILLLAFLLLALGSAAVLVATGGKKNRKPSANAEPILAAKAPASPAPQPLPDLDLLAPAAAARPAGAYRLTLAGGETVEAIEVMVLLRDIADGSLIAQIGGKSYACPPEGADAEFVRRYAIAVRDLSAAAVDVPRPARSAPAAPAAPPADPALPAPPDTPATPRSPAPSAGALPGDLPKFSSSDSALPSRLGRRPTSGPVPEINIAASIEAYLQYRLGADRRFGERSIHVLPAGADGVRIEVDNHIFDHIDDVTDPAVQDFLRQTIDEWQKRQ